MKNHQLAPRVLFCRSNPIDPDPRVEKEARALLKAGYQVEVIAWDRTGQLPSKELKDQFIIHRLAIPAGYARGMGNLPALIRWEWGLLIWLLRNGRSFDVLHACDFDTVLPALLTRWLYHKKLVYDIFDFYADHLRKTPGWIKKLIRWVDLQAVSRADAVILVDETRKPQIQGASPRRLSVIYNTPEDTLQILRSQSDRPAGETLRIVYVGLLQFERGLMELLAVLKKHPNWHLALAGFGGDSEVILQQASQLSHVTWYGRIPYQKTLQLTAAADVSFATYDPGIPNHRYASPNKIFEAMMLGIPIIAARDTNMDRIALQHECGLVVDYGDLIDLEKTLQKLADDPDLRERLGKNGRTAYEELYAWEIMARRLTSLYQDLLGN
jgi:glycosyltransferase involved in cell wall biosynthesis